MTQFPHSTTTRSATPWALACLLAVSVAHATPSLGEPNVGNDGPADHFDLICTTTMDRVEGTLADGSPVVPSAIGEVRRYSFDLVGRRYASNGRITAIHDIIGDTVVKADPNEIRSFAGVVHMQSQWHLDLASGISIRSNRFYSDGAGTTVTGGSEWHQQCERAPYSGMPAG